MSRTHRGYVKHRLPDSAFALAALAALAALGPPLAASASKTRGGSIPAPTVEGPIAAAAATSASAPPTAAAPPAPAIPGPIPGAPSGAFTTFDPAEVGYVQSEFFISGTARAYAADAAAGPLGADGKWTAAPAASDNAAAAPFKTRIVVFRPIEAARFNGVVFVEWLNVSGGVDAGADWIMCHTELMRSGCAYAGVSAQSVGIEGGAALVGGKSMPLKTTDPQRYGSLAHPGDSYSYDIFSQAAQALRTPAAVGAPDPLGGLRPKAVIAIGESQSAFRMVTYVNAVHPTADIFDGFFIHSRGGNRMSAAPLSQKPLPAVAVPGDARIRDDLNVPVFNFQTESDLTFLGSVASRQDDTDRFRLWEVAGAAHADAYTVALGMADRGDSPDAAKLVVTTDVIPGMSCAHPINSGPQHFVLNAAVAALVKWVREGVAPPIAPRLELIGDSKGDAPNKPAIARDPNGNALGGVRSPQLDVPIASFTGDPQPGSMMCMLFGAVAPFDEAKLTALYPTHAAYVAAFNAATNKAVAAGFLLPADAKLMRAAAESAAIPK